MNAKNILVETQLKIKTRSDVVENLFHQTGGYMFLTLDRPSAMKTNGLYVSDSSKLN